MIIFLHVDGKIANILCKKLVVKTLCKELVNLRFLWTDLRFLHTIAGLEQVKQPFDRDAGIWGTTECEDLP